MNQSPKHLQKAAVIVYRLNLDGHLSEPHCVRLLECIVTALAEAEAESLERAATLCDARAAAWLDEGSEDITGNAIASLAADIRALKETT